MLLRSCLRGFPLFQCHENISAFFYSQCNFFIQDFDQSGIHLCEWCKLGSNLIFFHMIIQLYFPPLLVVPCLLFIRFLYIPGSLSGPLFHSIGLLFCSWGKLCNYSFVVCLFWWLGLPNKVSQSGWIQQQKLSLFSHDLPSVCPNLFFLQGHQLYWIRSHPNDLILS